MGCNCEKCTIIKENNRLRALQEWNDGRREIVVKHWNYTCGDGCCDESGDHVYINDYHLDIDEYYNGGSTEVIRELANFLGLSVDIRYENSN